MCYKIVKPIDYKITLLIENIGNNIASILIYIPVYTIIFISFLFFKNYRINFAIVDCLLGILSAIVAFFLNYFFSLCFSILVFKSIKSHSVVMFKKTILAFLSGSLIPYAFYPKFMQKILGYLPTRFFSYDSIQIFLGEYKCDKSLLIILSQILCCIGLCILANVLWVKFGKKIMVYGG